MTESNTRLSRMRQQLYVFKSEFSSSFEKSKDSTTIKISDINAQSDEIEKKAIKN